MKTQGSYSDLLSNFEHLIQDATWDLCFIKKRFGGLYRQYCELVDTLSRSVIEHHTHLITANILQDADSHDFTHHKEFYEVTVHIAVVLC